MDLGDALVNPQNNAFRASCMDCLDNQYSNYEKNRSYREKSVSIFDRSSTVEERKRKRVSGGEREYGGFSSLSLFTTVDNQTNLETDFSPLGHKGELCGFYN